MGSPELSIPIQKEQICSVHKTFVLEFPVYKFRITFRADVESFSFAVMVKSSVVVSMLSHCFWGCISAVNFKVLI